MKEWTGEMKYVHSCHAEWKMIQNNSTVRVERREHAD